MLFRSLAEAFDKVEETFKTQATYVEEKFTANKRWENATFAALNEQLEERRQAVDAAMEAFGMAMGPIAVADLAGLDIGYKARKAIADYPDHIHNHIADQLVEKGRLGQKTGAGFYRYDPETRKRLSDPEVEAMIEAESETLGISRREFGQDEIVERIIYALVNEGARVLEEGIAQRPGDIDIAYIYGYGFPAHRGGPMFYASSVGLDKVYQRICEFSDSLDADNWQPAPLLKKLAKEKAAF